MRKKISAYWACQLGGWFFYGLTMLFFSFVYNQNNNPVTYIQNSTEIILSRVLISIALGILSTHILRQLIVSFKIHPPIEKNKWWILTILIIFICALYSLANSAIVEWLRLYNPKLRASFQRRSVMNFLGDSPIIIVWTSIYFVWHYVEATRKSEVEKVRLESLVKELELKTIKSHINPHFIFNALNSIRALVDENPQRARTAITELSNILRSSMQAEKVEMAPFERELNIVKDYLALEQIRFEDRLKVEYDIDDDTLDQPVPPMMLQTLVENAIKHGVSKHVNGGTIKIISDFKDNHHELIVLNSGKLNGQRNEEGFGIIGTQNRLNLLYGVKAHFELNDINGNMVEAKVIIPVKAIS